MDRVLACWEDAFGAWVVSSPPPEHPNAEPLETHWRRVVVAPGETRRSDDVEEARVVSGRGEVDSQGDTSMEEDFVGRVREEEEERLRVLRRYGEATSILIGVAEIVEVS